MEVDERRRVRFGRTVLALVLFKSRLFRFKVCQNELSRQVIGKPPSRSHDTTRAARAMSPFAGSSGCRPGSGRGHSPTTFPAHRSSRCGSLKCAILLFLRAMVEADEAAPQPIHLQVEADGCASVRLVCSLSACSRLAMYCCPHRPICATTGSRVRPKGVSEYSTLGGTCA